MSDSSVPAVANGGELEKRDGLDPKQQAAFEAVRAGQTFAQAARDVGVSRSTVYRWIQSDPHFKAAYNLWQQELAESARARLLKMSDKAVDVVESALNRKEDRVAMQMLTKLGVMRPLERKSTDPEVLRMQIELKQQREMFLAATAMVRHLLEKAGLDPKQQDEYIRTHGGRRPAAGLARAFQGPVNSKTRKGQGPTQAEMGNLDLQAVAQAMADRELAELDAEDPPEDGAPGTEDGASDGAPRPWRRDVRIASHVKSMNYVIF